MLETVAVHNLEVLCKIGIFEWEQGVAQKLQLDFELGFDFSPVIESRKLADTIDYADLAKKVEALLHGKNFGYLEVLVDNVTDLVFEQYPAQSFRIAVRKFSREVPTAAWVGVERKLSRLEWQQRRVARGHRAVVPPATTAADLRGRVALVTGGARGLGRALVEHLAARGADVAVHYRASEAEAQALCTALRAAHPGQRFSPVRADLSDRASTAALVPRSEAALGPVDVLVANVGHYVTKSLLEVSAAELAESLQVNVEANFVVVRAVVDGLLARRAGFGRVICVGQAGSTDVLARPFNSAYHVSKTALAVLARTFAHLAGPHGITVNLVNPGVLETSIDLPAHIDTKIPVGRLGTARDVVSAVGFLVSADAAYVNGAALDVSGGYGLEGSA